MKEWLYKNIDVFIIIILLLPLLLINISNYHNWGGDFAQYINQGLNIIDGKAHYETGYVFNPNYRVLAPEAYPVGFPLILTPVLYLFGNNMMALQFYTTLLTILFGVCCYCFLKLYAKKTYALAATIIFFYNPWMIYFKSLVLSDISFSICFILSLISVNLLFKRHSNIWAFIAGVFGGYAILIKSIAIVIPFSLLAFVVWDFIFNQNKDKIKPGLLTIFSSLLLYFLFGWIFGKSSNVELHFFSMISLEDMGDAFLRTSQYYIQIFQNYFHPKTNGWDFFPLILKACALCFLVIGFIKSCLHSFSYKEIVILAFLGGIFAFGNTSQGFRYILPIFPILLLYIIVGISSVNLEITSLKRWIIGLAVFIAILFTYKFDIRNIERHNNDTIEGPLTVDARELFSFLNNEIPKRDTFLFTKPRVLALYSIHSALSNDIWKDISYLEKDISDYKVDYFIEAKTLGNEPLKQYIKEHRSSLSLMYENETFKVYHKISE